MSEQQQKPKSFMQELDEWCNVTIIRPLIDPMLDFDLVEEQVKNFQRAQNATKLLPKTNGFFVKQLSKGFQMVS